MLKRAGNAPPKKRVLLRVKLRRSQYEQKSSGLRLKADIARCGRHVSNVPTAESALGDTFLRVEGTRDGVASLI